MLRPEALQRVVCFIPQLASFGKKFEQMIY